MKTTLLLGLILFLTACSDSTSESRTINTNTPAKEAVSADDASSAQQTEPVETAEKNAAPAQKTVQAETAVSGHALYVQKCASCHGHNAEKAALNNSKIIAGWDKERTVQALTGYQDGTYGGSMKGIMKGQTGSLSAEQIEALSDYISTL